MRRNPKVEWELWRSVQTLANRSDHIKVRLAESDEYHFHFISADDMPTKELKKKLLKAQSQLTKENTLPAHDALRLIRLKTCRAIADDICDLYYGYSHFEWHLHTEKNPPEFGVASRVQSPKSKRRA